MISYRTWRIEKLIICLLVILSIGSAVLLTEHIENVQHPFGHVTILKLDPHKYHGHYIRQLQTHRFHWTLKENSQYDSHSMSQVNTSYFLTSSNKNKSIIAKIMMDQLLMPIKLNSTFI